MAIDIKSFINDARVRGMSDDAIKSALLNMGVDVAEVNAALPIVVAKEIPTQLNIPQQAQPQASAPQQATPQTITSVTPTTSAATPQDAKETIIQTVGAPGAQPAAPSGGMSATNPVFGNQPVAAVVAPSELAPKSKKPLAIIIAAILILAGAGAGYFFFMKNKAATPSLPAETLIASTTTEGAPIVQPDPLVAIQGVVRQLGEVKTEQEFLNLLTNKSADRFKALGFSGTFRTETDFFGGMEYASGTVGADGSTAEVTIRGAGAASTTLNAVDIIQPQNIHFVLEGGSWKLDIMKELDAATSHISSSTLALGQERARDSRRVSDLRVIQIALELYYNKIGKYPPTSSLTALTKIIIDAKLGVLLIPNDPSTPAKTYYYGSDDNGTTYILGAKLEDIKNLVLKDSIAGVPAGIKISGITCAKASGEYCISL